MSAPGPAARPLRVLLVEDNPGDVYLIKLALAEEGLACEYRQAADGRAALEMVEDSGSPVPDVVVLDLNLPLHSGREVLEAIRASSTWARVPVVVLTSSSAASDRRDLLALGATTYIQKPSDLDEFLRIGARIREVV